MREGILVGGNWIVDQVKVIDRYPSQQALSNILSECCSNGGSAYNIVMDLNKLQAPFPVEGVGLVGDDGRGRQIISNCKALGINTIQLKAMPGVSTSYTDVMSVMSTGMRTFFHQRGANALLDEEHFDFSISTAKIFHLGYLMLLDKLDAIKDNGNTGAAEVLKRAGEYGLITSVDLVSQESEYFTSIVPPSLPYIDYLFLNEFEAWMLSGVNTTTGDNEISVERCYEAASNIISMGVRKWVVIHFPAASLAINAADERFYQPSLKIPPEKIGGSVGAGDAFAAGVLLGVHQGWPMQQCLNLGVCAAASSMGKSTCSDSVLPYQACLALANEYSYREVLIAL
jgi:sugar/nucleoside kinase (ribokinase family)